MQKQSFVQTTTATFPPIYLVGMMGSGKSYWCKAIVEHLQIDGIDLDAHIEKLYQQSISAIFYEKGEVFFREIEAAALRTFGVKKNIVIATGGGTPCFHDNMIWMNKHGITIWIDEPATVLTERLWKEKAHRPLVAHVENRAALTQFLTAKIEERNHFYRLADIHLKGEQLQINALLSAIRSFQNKSFNLNHS